jgi:hypothetical protein
VSTRDLPELSRVMRVIVYNSPPAMSIARLARSRKFSTSAARKLAVAAEPQQMLKEFKIYRWVRLCYSSRVTAS